MKKNFNFSLQVNYLHTHAFLLQQPFARSNYFLYSFVPNTISDWNSLPSDITSSLSLTSFKSSLLNYLS